VTKRIPWLPLALLSAIVVLGCGRAKPPPPAIVPEALVLKIACPGEPSAAVVKRYGQGWASTHSAKLEIVRVPDTESPGDREGIDLWIIPTPALPRLASAGRVQPIPEKILERDSGYQWQSLLPIYRNKLLTWDGKPHALPLLGDASLCYYREDWLREVGKAFQEKHGRALTPPETWETFAELAEVFRDRSADKTLSLPPLPERGDELNRLFYTMAASYDRRIVREDDPAKPADVELFSFHYDLDTLRPRLAKPAFVHALSLLRRMQACRPEGAAAQPAEAFRDGKAGLCIAGPEWIDRFQNDGSKVRGKFGIAPLPGSAIYHNYRTGQAMPAKGNFIPYLGAGGWLGVVPKGAPHAAEAFQLLAHLSSPTTSAEIVSEPAWGGAAYRREHLAGAASWDGFALGAERTRGLLDALRAELTPAAINPAVALRTPDAAEHEKVLAEELRGALQGGKEPAATLAEVVKRWEALDSKKDEAARRREYRLSLGLAGK
jgi:multiple sugar transport system substrate-binding protein